MASKLPKPDEAFLGWIEQGDTPGKHNIGSLSTPLSDAEWEEYQSVCQICPELRERVIDFVSVEREARALQQAPSEFAAELDQVEHPLLIGGIHSTLGLAVIQSTLTNYLSATSAFLDRANRYLSRRFGKPSPQFDAFNALTSKLFDEVFAYSLFRGMRNYSQHRAIPISAMQVNAARDESGGLKFAVTHAGISRLELLQALIDEKKQPKLQAVLKARTEESYDLSVMVATDLRCFEALFFELLQYHKTELATMELYQVAVQRALTQHASGSFTPVIFRGKMTMEHASPALFGFDELAYIQTLAQRTEGSWKVLASFGEPAA